MGKTEHLKFLLLMIPTFLVLCVAAVCLADLALPAVPEVEVVTADPAAEQR